MPTEHQLDRKITAPAEFVPLSAMSFGAFGSTATSVSPSNPLPVSNNITASSATAAAAVLSADGTIGPFSPELGRPIWLTLSGEWHGTARVLRSTDEGMTRAPVTIAGREYARFASNAQEPIGEESVAGALWYVEFAHSGGTLQAEMSQ